MLTKKRKKELDNVVKKWLDFTQAVGSLTEEEAKYLLDAELSKTRRPTFALRLYTRYATTRKLREIEELSRHLAVEKP